MMIPNGRLQVGNIILYKLKNRITEWEINTISPSGDYFEIENDDFHERWVYRGEILEIMETKSGDVALAKVIVEPEKPIIQPRTSDFVKHEV